MDYKKILIAMDREHMKDGIFERATSVARSQNAELLMLYCFPGFEHLQIDESGKVLTRGGLHPMKRMYPVDDIEIEQKLQEELHRAQTAATEWIQPYVQKASDQQISAQYKCIPFRSNPAAEICRQAEDWEADLIIVGRHGRTGLAEAFLGSVSNYIVHHAHCSVLVVQQKAKSDPEN